MTSDSFAQHSAAIAGFYSNHHPALMSFVWRQLLWFHPTSGGIFLLHMLFYVSSSIIFIKIFKGSAWRYFYSFLILFPPILQFAFFIWKDVGMTFAYLLCSALLARATMHNRFLKPYEIAIVLIVLIYGSAVKFQGQFIVVILCAWAAWLPFNGSSKIQKIGKMTIAYALIVGSVYMIDYTLVPPSQESHSWQKVKIYDLSGMSLELNQPLYPDYILESKYFDMKRVKELFNRYRVDEMLFREDTPVPEGKNYAERAALLGSVHLSKPKNKGSIGDKASK